MKKIIVVTGASSGMGKEFLLQILEREKNIDEVWAIARREERLNELKEKVSEKILKNSMAKGTCVAFVDHRLDRAGDEKWVCCAIFSAK